MNRSRVRRTVARPISFGRLARDDAEPSSSASVRAYHETALAWLRYVDPEKVHGAIESIFAEYDVRYVAPIHGNPIAGEDVDRYLDRLYRSIERISDAYDVPE